MEKLGNSEVNPIFESLEPRILLSGSPAPDTGPEDAVFVESGHQDSVAEFEVSEILFVDQNVEGSEVLLENLNRNVQIVTINSNEDGLSQIHDFLRDHSGLSAIHIFSHGSAGQLSLGSSNIDFTNLNSQQTSQLQDIGKSFTADADLFVYGCDFADNTEAVDTLSSLTGLDIAASTDLTGNSKLGGDWSLEYTSGEVNSTSIFSSEGMTRFEGVLPAPDYSGIPNTNKVLHLDAQNVDGSGNDTLTDGDVADDWSADANEWKEQSSVSGDGTRISGNVSTIDFDGLDTADGVDINTSGFTVANNARTNLLPQDEYSISTVFKTGADVSTTQTIYEQGGGTRGYGIFIFDGDIYGGVWNNASGEWTSTDKYKFVNLGAAQANTVYNVTIVQDSETDSVGTLTGFLNGKQVAQETEVGVQRAHSGRIGIGQVDNGARLPDGSNAGKTLFQGQIGEIIIWDDALSSTDIDNLTTYSESRWTIPNVVLANGYTEVTSPGSNLNTGDTISFSVDFGEDMTLSAGATVSVDVEVENFLGGTTTYTASFTSATELTAQSFTVTTSALVADHFDEDGVKVLSNTISVTGGTLQNGDGDDVTGNSEKVLDIKVDSTEYRDLHAVSTEMALHFDAQFQGLSDGAAVTSLTNLSDTANASNSGGTKTFDTDGINGREAILLDGNGGFNVANNTLLNSYSNADPKKQYSIGMVFKTGSDVASDQTVYEQGGGARGYGVHIQGEKLFFGAWNNIEWDSGHQFKFAELGNVEADTVYFITLVHEATDLSNGSLKIYNNGVLATEIDHVGEQRSHGGGIGFGRINGSAVYPDNKNKGGPRGFDGHLGEIAIWNDALDNGQVSKLNSFFGSHWGIDTAPEITSITSALGGGDNKFGVGEAISANVNFSESVTLSNGATVSVTLKVDVEGGGTRDFIASYTNNSGSSETFSSLVLSTPVLADTDLLDSNGVEVVANSFALSGVSPTLVDAGGNSVGTSPSETLSITVDTTVANVLSATIASDNYSLGEVIIVNFTANKAGLTLDSGTLAGIALENFQDLGGGNYRAQITVPAGLEATSLTTNIVLDDAGTKTDPFVQPIDISPGRVDGIVPTVSPEAISVTVTEFVGGETVTISWDNSVAGDNNTDVGTVVADVSFLGGPVALSLSDSGGGIFTATFTVPVTPGLTGSSPIFLTVSDTAGNSSSASGAQILTVSIPDNFIPPINSQSALLAESPGTAGVNIPPVTDAGVNPQNNLQFVSSGSNEQFDGEFLSADYLSVINGVFNGNTDPESEVADVGGVEQEVKDQNVYDESQLPQEDLKFIEDLMNENVEEEEEDDELSFESSNVSFQELTAMNVQQNETLAQKDLDNKISLEDTLVGDFDCFNAE